jgi:hypothetical protein
VPWQELTPDRDISDWQQGDQEMRGVLLWLIGIPIPIIILLYLFRVI